MEAATVYWIIGAGLAGLASGALITWLISRMTMKSKPYRELESQHVELRDKVTEHFVKTAGLVNQMTDSYKAVFEQLQEGASQLLDEQTLRERLAHDDADEVRLGKIGYRKNHDQQTDRSAAPVEVDEVAETPGTIDPENAADQEPPRF